MSGNLVHFRFHYPKPGWDFYALIEACFVIAWDDDTSAVSWHDECSLEVQIAPDESDMSTFKPVVSPGKFLAWRPHLISALAQAYAPRFATETYADGKALDDQTGTAIIEIHRPAMPSAHETIVASDLLRSALEEIGLAEVAILKLLGPPFC